MQNQPLRHADAFCGVFAVHPELKNSISTRRPVWAFPLAKVSRKKNVQRSVHIDPDDRGLWDFRAGHYPAIRPGACTKLLRSVGLLI